MQEALLTELCRLSVRAQLIMMDQDLAGFRCALWAALRKVIAWIWSLFKWCDRLNSG